MSTMPRLGHSSFGESFSTSQKSGPKTPSFISRDNTSSPDDWLNTDDVATRGNISDEEQVSQFQCCYIWQFIANLADFDPVWLPKFSQKWAAKALKLATCCSIFVAKKLVFLTPKIFFWQFYTSKKMPTLKLNTGFLLQKCIQ